MRTVNCEQLSDEWFELRGQRMTASHAQAIAANSKGLDTYVTQLMQEFYSNGGPVRYQSKPMERGIELEPSARFAYEMETGLEVEQVGFVIHDEHSGCSPDGLVGTDGCVEIKCLEDKAYFQYLMDGKIDTKYEWQMQCQMLMCERKWCDFVLYNPNFKKSLIITRVCIDIVKSEKLEQGFLTGIEKINGIKNKMKGVL